MRQTCQRLRRRRQLSLTGKLVDYKLANIDNNNASFCTRYSFFSSQAHGCGCKQKKKCIGKQKSCGDVSWGEEDGAVVFFHHSFVFLLGSGFVFLLSSGFIFAYSLFSGGEEDGAIVHICVQHSFVFFLGSGFIFACSFFSWEELDTLYYCCDA